MASQDIFLFKWRVYKLKLKLFDVWVRRAMTWQRAPSRDSEHKINVNLLLVAPLSALSVFLKLIELSQLYKYLKEIFWDQKVMRVKMKPFCCTNNSCLNWKSPLWEALTSVLTSLLTAWYWLSGGSSLLGADVIIQHVCVFKDLFGEIVWLCNSETLSNIRWIKKMWFRAQASVVLSDDALRGSREFLNINRNTQMGGVLNV